MPFESEAQRRFMYAKHPGIARKWSKEYPDQGKLPEHKGDKKPTKVGVKKKGKS